MLTLLQAAKEVGRTKGALYQKIKNGKLSATRDSDGNYQIDPVELYRVYSTNKRDNNKELNDSKHVEDSESLQVYIARLETELNAAKDALEHSKKDTQDWKERYNSSERERRETAEKLTAMLTNQAAPKKGILARILGT